MMFSVLVTNGQSHPLASAANYKGLFSQTAPLREAGESALASATDDSPDDAEALSLSPAFESFGSIGLSNLWQRYCLSRPTTVVVPNRNESVDPEFRWSPDTATRDAAEQASAMIGPVKSSGGGLAEMDLGLPYIPPLGRGGEDPDPASWWDSALAGKPPRKNPAVWQPSLDLETSWKPVTDTRSLYGYIPNAVSSLPPPAKHLAPAYAYPIVASQGFTTAFRPSITSSGPAASGSPALTFSAAAKVLPSRMDPSKAPVATASLPAAIVSVTPTFSPSSPTTEWVRILYPGDSTADLGNDHQTGSSEGDIIGNNRNPSMYMRFDSGGSSLTTEGWWSFRLRLGGDVPPTGFKAAAFVGLDADMDGSVDLFLGVNNQGSTDQLGIWLAGNGANTSPTTTDMITPAVRTYTPSVANYAFPPIDQKIDPGVTSIDLDLSGRQDRFLTWILPFADVVGMLGTAGISGVDRDTHMQFMAATSTQPNSFNQDLNGVTGGINASETWGSLGGFSQTYTPASLTPVPEPGSHVLLSAGLGFGILILLQNRNSSRGRSVSGFGEPARRPEALDHGKIAPQGADRAAGPESLH
jgi:hypothetical protein